MVKGGGDFGLHHHLTDLDEDLDELDLRAPSLAEDTKTEAPCIILPRIVLPHANRGVENLGQKLCFGCLEGVLLRHVDQNFKLAAFVWRTLLYKKSVICVGIFCLFGYFLRGQ